MIHNLGKTEIANLHFERVIDQQIVALQVAMDHFWNGWVQVQHSLCSVECKLDKIFRKDGKEGSFFTFRTYASLRSKSSSRINRLTEPLDMNSVMMQISELMRQEPRYWRMFGCLRELIIRASWLKSLMNSLLSSKTIGIFLTATSMPRHWALNTSP